MNPSPHSFRNFHDFMPVFGIGDSIRNMYFPIRKRALHGFQPFGQSGFSGIDFLSSSDKADYRCPTFMPVHDAHEKLGLRLVKIVLALLGFHKIRGHLFRPSPLGLIEHHDSINRGILVLKISVSEMMNVLDESFHFPPRFSFRHPLSIGRLLFGGVPS